MTPGGLGRRATGRRRRRSPRRSTAVGGVTLVDEVVDYIAALVRGDARGRGPGVRRLARAPARCWPARRARGRRSTGATIVIPDDVKALAPRAAAPPRDPVAGGRDRRAARSRSVVAGIIDDDRGAALIYPTRAAVIATAAGAPVALAVGRGRAGAVVACAGLAVALILSAVRVRRGARRAAARSARIDLPRVAYVGETSRTAPVDGADRAARPRGRRVALAHPPLVARRGRRPAARAAAKADAAPVLLPLRDAAPRTSRASTGCGCAGPVRSAWSGSRQRSRSTRHSRSCPDLRPVHDEASQHVRARRARRPDGAARARRGRRTSTRWSNSAPGMDRRAIDWKQSAPPRQAARQAIPHRAQQPDRLRDRYRAADVRAGRRPAARRPLRFGDAC